jgi:hypothetical protein
MAQQMVRGGAALDIPTADENADAVDGRLRAFYAEQAAIEDARQREYARGLKRMETFIAVVPAAATFFTGSLVDEGFVWSLRTAGINTAGGGLPVIYKASASGDTRRPIWVDQSTGTVHSATWSSDQVRLRHGDGLYLTSGGNLTGIWLSAWQVPAEREYEFA